MKFISKSILILAVLLAMLVLSGCESQTDQKNQYRTYPINRPAGWENNNMMPGASF